MGKPTDVRINELIQEQLPRAFKDNGFTPDSTLESLGLDSLDMVELAMSLEDEFNIEIPDEKRETIKTVQDIYTAVEEQCSLKR